MNDSVFTKIIKQEIPAEIVWENEDIMVLMDSFPVIDGQVLVIPKKQIDKFYDLDDELYSKVFLKAKEISKVLEEVFKKKRVLMILEGFEVPHAHIKLFPNNSAVHTLPAETNDELKSRIKENCKKIQEALLPKELFK